MTPRGRRHRHGRGSARERIHFAPLAGDDAPQIAQLERAAHRPQSVEGLESLRDDLEGADYEGTNVSLGLFDGSRLVGAMLAYGLESSARPGSESEPPPPAGSSPRVVYLADLAIQKGYRHHLGEMMARAWDHIRRRYPDLPLEAHSFEPELRLWRRLAPAVAALGYRLATTVHMGRHSGLDLHWVRWEAAPTPPPDPRSLPVEETHSISGETYALRIVRDETHWAGLEPLWDDLLERTPGATAFQSYAYLRAWWRCFGERRRLLILTFWRGTELCGIAPLQVAAPRSWLGHACELGVIGSRWELDRPRALLTGRPDPCRELLLRFLDRPEAPWDRIHLYEQEAGAPLTAGLVDLGRRRRHPVLVRSDSICPYLTLEGSFEQLLAERPRRFRRGVRGAHHKLERAGALELRRHRTWPDLREALAAYRALEARSWKHGTGAGLESPDRSAFYDELLATLGPKEQLQILLLELDGRPIAGTIALVRGRRYYSLQITHDKEYASYSPGTVLEYLEIADCFAGGYVEYDFLGGFLANKLRWTDRTRETHQIDLLRRGLAARLRYVWEGSLAPWLKRRLERAGLLERALRLHGRLKDRLKRALGVAT